MVIWPPDGGNKPFIPCWIAHSTCLPFSRLACSDEDELLCAFYKNEGYCSDLGDVMKDVCPVSCEMCY